MEKWAKKAAELNMRCARCRSIARRSFRGELLTDTEQQHIEQHVSAVLGAARERPTAGKRTQPAHAQARPASPSK